MTRQVALLTGLVTACSGSGGDDDDDTNANITVESSFELTANPYADQPGMANLPRYVDVWGLSIMGEVGVPDASMLYVANVLAELLDNDEDGQPDDAAVLTALRDHQALMPIFAREGSAAEDDFFENYDGDGVSAVLYNGEVDPTAPGHWGSDASVEEMLHTVNALGHVSVYPAAFALTPGSSRLTDAMDVARGGQFTTVPAEYPDDAWYHYDDRTCDYRCMAIEYLYWAVVTDMSILDDPQTCAGIANEWEPCSPALLESTDTLVFALVNDSAVSLPQIAPDGLYAP